MIIFNKDAQILIGNIERLENIDRNTMSRQDELRLYHRIILSMQSAIPAYYSTKIDMEISETKFEMDNLLRNPETIANYSEIDGFLASLRERMRTWVECLASHKTSVVDKDEEKYVSTFGKYMRPFTDKSYLFNYSNALLDMRSELYLLRHVDRIQTKSQKTAEIE